MRSDILYDSVGDTYIRHVIMLNMAKRSGIQSSFCNFRHATTSLLGIHSRF